MRKIGIGLVLTLHFSGCLLLGGIPPDTTSASSGGSAGTTGGGTTSGTTSGATSAGSTSSGGGSGCNSSQPEPSTCAWGTYCSSSDTCQPMPSCVNSTAPVANQSPVIWGTAITGTAVDTTGICTSSSTVTNFSTSFYLVPGDTLDSGHGGYHAIVVVNSSGEFGASDPGGTGNTLNLTSINGTASGTFTFQLCNDDTSASAVVLRDSNGHYSNSDCLPSF